MTTPSGQIGLSDVNTELGNSSTAQINMNNADVRSLAGVSSGAISMSNLQSKSFAPTISSITGSIITGIATSLTIAGTRFNAPNNVTVNFTQSSDSINEDVVVTPASDTSLTVSVPANVYNNVTAGNDVTITVTNSDTRTSAGSNLTAVASPSGGTISTSGDFRIHTFTSSGTFTNTIANLEVEYLVIAGGGGGSQSRDATGGGGGGAGGYRTSVVGQTSGGGSSAEAKLTLSTGDKTVTIGGGGGDRTDGNDSVFDSITSIGGGKGAGYSRVNGGNGGSGGGQAFSQSAGSGTSGQGTNGGSGGGVAGSGGGGASATGTSGGGSTGGNGGAGQSSNINGSTTTRAGGGGGGSSTGYGSIGRGQGGSGGGGAGGAEGQPGGDSPQNGTGNTGGGGGGPIGNGGQNSGGQTGGTGGSGLVIVRYDVTSL
tara:strand:+ start:1522 stop:2805 length:1284 start_codon:yes stop_codon:yes gene_type:complete